MKATNAWMKENTIQQRLNSIYLYKGPGRALGCLNLEYLPIGSNFILIVTSSRKALTTGTVTFHLAYLYNSPRREFCLAHRSVANRNIFFALVL